MDVTVWVGVVPWDVYSFLFVVVGCGGVVVWRHVSLLFPLFDISAQDIFGPLAVVCLICDCTARVKKKCWCGDVSVVRAPLRHCLCVRMCLCVFVII